MVCIHVWRCNMTRINTWRLWCFKEFKTIYTSISGELQSSSTRGRRLSCSNFDWRVSSAAPKSDFVPLSSKDPGQEALIIKPLLYYVFSTTISLFRCTLYPLISTSNNSTLGLLSLYLTVYSILLHYISCPSRGNGQFHCKSSKNQTSSNSLKWRSEVHSFKKLKALNWQSPTRYSMSQYATVY